MQILKKYFLGLLIFLLIPLSTFSQPSDTGCFLDQESPFYCQDVTEQEATDFCQYFSSCLLENVFKEGQSCSNFPECQTILCKGFCLKTFAGLCPDGEVPDGEEAQWCSPGCCQFQQGNATSCIYDPDRWHCELDAENAEAKGYKYALNVSPNACLACLKPLPISEIIFPVENKTLPPREVKEQGLPWWALMGILAVILAAIYSFFHQVKKGLAVPPPSGKKPWYFPFASNPFRRAKIEQMKKEHQHQAHQHQREEFLAEHHLLAKEKPELDEFGKLQKLSSKQQKKTDTPKEDVFEKLDEVWKK